MALGEEPYLPLLFVDSAGAYHEVFAQGDAYGNMVMSNPVHRHVHDGRLFSHTKINSLAAGATYNYLLSTPSSADIHFRLAEIEADGTPFVVSLYEGPVVTSYGAAQGVVNHNRKSSNTSVCSLWGGSVVTSTGLLLGGSRISGAVNGGGDADFFNHEYILQNSKDYLVQVTNNSAQAQGWNMRHIWYEAGIHLD